MSHPTTIFKLLPSEFFAVVLFVSLNAAVAGLAGYFAFKMLLNRNRSVEGVDSKRLPRIAYCMFLLASIQLTCLAYSFFVEPFQLEVTTTVLSSRKLVGLKRPIRLIHISDIHSDPFIRLEERLPQEIAKLNPDLIVFTGDAVNSENSLRIFRRCITRIAAIAPTFVVYGNHDSRGAKKLDLYGGTGVSVINCKVVNLICNGQTLALAGVSVDGESCLDSVLRALPKDAFNVLLYHYPAIAERVSSANVDLFCSGHTHGGQIRLPFYGSIITRSETGKKYEAGLYHVGNMSLYVNRGIGMVGDLVPRLRFLCKPEISLIELRDQTSRDIR